MNRVDKFFFSWLISLEIMALFVHTKPGIYIVQWVWLAVGFGTLFYLDRSGQKRN